MNRTEKKTEQVQEQTSRDMSGSERIEQEPEYTNNTVYDIEMLLDRAYGSFTLDKGRIRPERPKIEKKVSGVSEEKSKIKPSFESEIRGSSSPGKILTEEFNFDDFNAETSPKPAQAEIKTEETEKCSSPS